MQYQCSRCGVTSPASHWNEETMNKFGPDISRIENGEGCYFTCPSCKWELKHSDIIEISIIEVNENELVSEHASRLLQSPNPDAITPEEIISMGVDELVSELQRERGPLSEFEIGDKVLHYEWNKIGYVVRPIDPDDQLVIELIDDNNDIRKLVVNKRELMRFEK